MGFLTLDQSYRVGPRVSKNRPSLDPDTLRSLLSAGWIPRENGEGEQSEFLPLGGTATICGNQ